MTSNPLTDPDIRLSTNRFSHHSLSQIVMRWAGLLLRANIPLVGEAQFPGGKRTALRWRSVHDRPVWYPILLNSEVLRAISPYEMNILFVGSAEDFRREKGMEMYFENRIPFLRTEGYVLVLNTPGLSLGEKKDPVFVIPLPIIPVWDGRVHLPKKYVKPTLLGEEIESRIIPMDLLRDRNNPDQLVVATFHQEDIEKFMISQKLKS